MEVRIVPVVASLTSGFCRSPFEDAFFTAAERLGYRSVLNEGIDDFFLAHKGYFFRHPFLLDIGFLPDIFIMPDVLPLTILVFPAIRCST